MGKHRATVCCVLTVAAGCTLLAAPVWAQEVAPEAPLSSLKGVRPPGPPDAELGKLVRDRGWLVALGKALFWDTAIGSDGVACASCHFNGGADPRLVNQLNPGLLVQPLADDKFGGVEPAGVVGKTGSGAQAGPNYALKAGDFPFHRLADAGDRNSAVLYDTNDVASSQGSFDGLFVGAQLRRVRFRGGRLRDFCNPGTDGIFTINVAGRALKTRRVEPRNTPTMINAAYFFRNFWDGRADNVFNGVTPHGPRDNAARIVTQGASGLAAETLRLENMSLASQAVGPPLSDFEMACAGKKFADIGRKILPRRALSTQKIAATDGVLSAGPLGNLSSSAGPGLRPTYREMVQNAFQPRLWQGLGTHAVSGNTVTPTPAPAGFTQAELNFSLFFGLAVDAYERTLISDDTPFDRGLAPGSAAQRGREVFEGKGKCTACHVGPLLSGAAVPPRQRQELVERMAMGDGGEALYDGGFYNIGVRPTFEDVGVGEKDPFGNPLSFARRQAGTGQRVAVDGAFKTPGLRNVGMTAPYFHNGGEKSLRDVVEFYNRGGNRRGPAGNDTTGTGPLGQSRNAEGMVTPGMGGSNLDPDIEPLGLSEQEKGDLVEFMRALTDRRVACHAAPFDHPELVVTNGHKQVVVAKRAKDARLRLREVGKAGYPSAWCDTNTGDLFTRNNLVGGMLQPLP